MSGNMNNIHLKVIKSFGIVSFLMILLFSCQAQAETAGSGKEVIKEKCLKCHNAQRIFIFKRTPQEWAVTLRRMQEKSPQWLSDADITACADFLSAHYALTGKELFEELCVVCHSRIGNKQLLYQPKTKPAWALAIERMRRKYSFLIGVTDAQKINEFWTDRKNNRNLKVVMKENDFNEALFEAKCGRCHTYNFIYGQKKTKKDWPQVLTRMQKKSPRWISQEDLGRIKKFIFGNKKLITR